VTALAIALAYLGTLAFVAFNRWAAVKADTHSHEERITALEHAAGSPAEPSDYAEIRETVSTLALASGMRRNGLPVSKG
jgi:hypothetical protein